MQKAIVVAAVAADAVKKSAYPENSDLVPFLAGFTFFCASLELLIPKPLPFFRLGLANGVIMLALPLLDFKRFFLLLGLKVIGQALVSGTLFSYIFLFSLGGTFCSGLAMYALKRIFGSHISYVGVSCVGGILSATTHLALAYALVFGQGVKVFAAPVLGVSLATSVALGGFVLAFSENSNWYRQLRNQAPTNIQIILPPPKNKKNKNFYWKLGFAIFVILALLWFNDLRAKAFFFGAMLAVCLGFRVKVRFRPMVFFLVSMIFVNIFIPNGKILFEIFGLKVTAGALLLGLERFLQFQVFVLISKWLTQTEIPIGGFFGECVSKSFFVFNKFFEKKPVVSRSLKGLVGVVDTYCASVYNSLNS